MARRGEVWTVDLGPTRGHEQRGKRPALVVSADMFNEGPAGIVVVVPMTTTDRRVPLHVALDPPNGGVRHRSFAMCEMVRSISTERLGTRCGLVDRETMSELDDRLRVLLEL